MTIKTITNEHLLEQLDKHVVVDVRSTAAFNGWQLRGEARGGHIPGAALLPDSWLEGLTDEELTLLLENKGISRSRSIVLYGDTPEQGDQLHQKLTGFGYTDVVTYQGGFGQWAADPTLPVEGLARYERLVHPEWVRQLVAGENPDTYRGNGFLLFHVNFGVPEEYRKVTFPGPSTSIPTGSSLPMTGTAAPRKSFRRPSSLSASLLRRRWSSMAATRWAIRMRMGLTKSGQAAERGRYRRQEPQRS